MHTTHSQAPTLMLLILSCWAGVRRSLNGCSRKEALADTAKNPLNTTYHSHVKSRLGRRPRWRMSHHQTYAVAAMRCTLIGDGHCLAESNLIDLHLLLWPKS